MLLVVDPLHLIRRELIFASRLFGVLYLLPDVVSDGGPNLLVDLQVSLGGHFLRKLLIKGQLFNVLRLKEVFLELLEANMLILDKTRLILEVTLPLYELLQCDVDLLAADLIAGHIRVAPDVIGLN